MQTCKQIFYENLNLQLSKKNISGFLRTSNSVYNFHMFLCLSTNDTTAYTYCPTCPLYTEKVSYFFKTGNSEGKLMIYMLVIFDIDPNLLFEAC